VSLVVAVLLGALLVGRLCGGSLERLGARGVRRRRLVVAALLAQALGAVVGGPGSAVGLAASAGLAAAFLLANRGVRGTGLVALGLTANALVVGVNGAMPVSAAAAARAQVPLVDVEAGLDSRHELETPQTRLALLDDRVPVLLPLRPEVVSAGDVLVAAGLGQLVVTGMLTPLPLDARRAGRRPPSRPTGPASPATPTAPRAGRRPRRASSHPRPSGDRSPS
jgi:hypothetical protein